MMTGILNINKPIGMTSSDVVCKVRRILGTRAVGHMGTLDPLAEGVLLIGVGKATKLFDFFLSKDKIYTTTFTFGYETDTLDRGGVVINTCDKIPSKAEILSKLPSQIGKISQIPPKYSAKSINGVRAYDLARQGIDFEIKKSDINIFDLRLLSSNGASFDFELHCSSGTYVRSVCRDLAYSVMSLATMTELTRRKAGDFLLSESVTLEELEIKKDSALMSIESVLGSLPKFIVPENYYFQLCNGVRLSLDDLPQSDFLIYCKDELFGIGYNNSSKLAIKTYLRG